MMIEGVVEVTGTVKVDNTDQIESYLKMARSSIASCNNEEAEQYSNKIIEIDNNHYEAWLIKGQAAGWQSTLANIRLSEAVSCFAKAINNSPEDEKENVIAKVKEQIINISKAIMSLMNERFTKWPDEEEATGVLNCMTEAMRIILELKEQTGILLNISDVMIPVTAEVNQAAVNAYQKTIYPEYKSDKYPYPDDNDFSKFIERLNYCISIIESSIGTWSDDDDTGTITKYENLIFLQKQAIDACSYDSEYYDYDPYNMGSTAAYERIVRNNGFIPDSRNSRYYYKSLCLNDVAKNSRRASITEYERKIKDIKDRKRREEEEKKREEERKKREEERKKREEETRRTNEFWENNAKLKESLLSEKSVLTNHIKELQASQRAETEPYQKEKTEITQKTKAEIEGKEKEILGLLFEIDNLGFFKKKEKAELQEKINKLKSEKEEIQKKADTEISSLDVKIKAIEYETNQKIAAKNKRIKEIENELTKPR